jgi:hypothetical protein
MAAETTVFTSSSVTEGLARPGTAEGAEVSSDTTHPPEASKQEASEPTVGLKNPHPSSDSSVPLTKGLSPCDSSASQYEPPSGLSTPAGHVARIHVPVSEQMSNKARLLYYFPPDPATYHLAGDWCGWHYDIGTITGACLLCASASQLMEWQSTFGAELLSMDDVLWHSVKLNDRMPLCEEWLLDGNTVGSRSHSGHVPACQLHRLEKRGGQP